MIVLLGGSFIRLVIIHCLLQCGLRGLSLCWFYIIRTLHGAHVDLFRMSRMFYSHIRDLLCMRLHLYAGSETSVGHHKLLVSAST